MLDQAEIEEASYNTTPPGETQDQQSDQSDPRVSKVRLNDDNLSLFMSPPNMSPTTSNVPSMFATQWRGTGREELDQKLRDERIKSCEQEHAYFIPRDKQNELITVSAIEDEIRDEDIERKCQDPGGCARWAHQHAKQLFTILCYMGKGGKCIYQMYMDGISDNDLPLEAVEKRTRAKKLRRKSDKKVLPAFDDWMDDHREDFARFQWWVLVPKFDKRDLKCREFLDQTVLPLIDASDEGASDEGIPQMKLAGFSTVTAYRIHSAHHNFWSLPSVSEDHQPLVAIKKLLETDNEEEYEKERSILVILGPYKHPNLIKLLATYRLKRHYHFIFPCAQANLRNFWEMRQYPTFDGVTLLWSLRQMCGLASALELIHTFKTTIDLKPPGGVLLDDDSKLEVEKGEEKYGRHGDIKPENILWFKQALDIKEVDNMGVLQITDFGLGRFHGRESRSKVDPKTVNATPTYEPPECKLEKPVSRAYDIWSMACLYLEFATWLLEGTQAIHDFGDARGERREPFLIINDKRHTIVRDTIINDDNFFTILRDENNLRSAVVREAVVQWVERLHIHSNCSKMLHDLLDLVMDDLLRPYSSQRINSTSLKKKMRTILDKAESNPGYLLKPSPRPTLPPSPSSAAGQRSLSRKGVRFAETWPTKNSPPSPRSPK